MSIACEQERGWRMRYQVAFRGRWQGAVLHAFDDLDPRWDPGSVATVVDVPDQSALVALMHRANDFGLTVVGVTAVGGHPTHEPATRTG
jgi:hypothetical protein